MPVPKRIMAPTIIPITIGSGIHLMIFPISPERPSTRTMMPAIRYAPEAS